MLIETIARKGVVEGRETASECSSSRCSLTEGALLVTLAVSIPLGTDAAVVAGTVLEVVAPGAGMLSLTPTELQTSVAKARVTGKSGTVSNGRTYSGVYG